MSDYFLDAIAKLTTQEQAYLCFMAYTGKELEQGNFKFAKVEGLNDMDYRDVRKMKEGLASKAILRSKVMSSEWLLQQLVFYEIDPIYYIRAIVFMMTEHPEWVQKFQRHRSYGSWNDLAVEIGKFLSGKDADVITYSEKHVYLPDYALEVIEMALTMDGWERLAMDMSDTLLHQILKDLIASAECGGDILKLRLAYKLLTMQREWPEELHYLYSNMRMLWFYFTGELLEPKYPKSMYVADGYLEAALYLYEDDVDAAMDFYERTLEVSDPSHGIKGVPDDALTLLLYVIALGLRQGTGDLAKLQWLEPKIEKINRTYTQAVIPFVTYLKDGRQTVTTDFSYLKKSRCDLAKGIVNLFKMYVGEKPGERTIVESECALLQNEIWALGGDDDKSPMPYEPLLGKIKRKEQWQVNIEAIMAKASGEETVKTFGGDETRRTIYYVEGRWDTSNYLNVKVQKKTKKGEWSKGAMLSESDWYFKSFAMDDVDAQIYGDWKMLRNKSKVGAFPTLEMVLKYCKGTDKLYTDYEKYGYGPVEIIEEKPYIYTERKNGRIIFYSNIPEDAVKNMYKWSQDRRSITFWQLEEDVRELFTMVVRLGSVPESAEPMLEKMMPLLMDKVEIQSDIQGAMQLEEREGNTLLTLRVTPEMGHYMARFMVRPLECGYKYVEAGKGEEVIVDSDGKTRYKVMRNIKGEKSNCKRVCDLLGYDRLRYEAFMDASGLLTLMDAAEEMKDVYYIEWPKGETLKMIKPSASAWNISAVGKGGWFEIEGELKVSESKVLTVAQLLELIRGGEGQFVRLSSGEYLKLSKKIRSQLSQLDAVSQNYRGKITIPELAMTFMKDALDDVVDVEDYEMVDERKRLMREAADMDYPLPEGLNAVLRPYQVEGYRWLMSLSHWGAGACLADDMGLGKTVQSIAFMLAKAANGPQMVVAPASVVGNWSKELARFSPSLRVTMLNEMASSERSDALAVVGAGCVVVATYGLLVTEKEVITGVKWDTVVLDEAHTIKNKETKMSSVAMKLEAKNKIMLTGTPVQNHLGELWNLFRFINPGLLGSYEHFQEKFVGAESNGSREALKRLVAPFLLRRTKNEVVKELPDKVEVTIPVQMDEEEMAVYEVIRRQARKELEAGGVLSVNALAMMTKLRMAACSAMLAEKSWKGGCSKLDAFIEKLLPIIESGHSVLVFSQFTSFLSMARERLESEGVKSFLYLDGSTPVAKRQKMVEQFQRGEQQVFLISLKAGGLGLNLTGANYVIHLDPWWNPAVEQQATDRAYRIGQQQKVTVYHLIAEGTIEEKIVRLHDTKREMADSILEGRSTAMRLTPEELMKLIQ